MHLFATTNISMFCMVTDTRVVTLEACGLYTVNWLLGWDLWQNIWTNKTVWTFSSSNGSWKHLHLIMAQAKKVCFSPCHWLKEVLFFCFSQSKSEHAKFKTSHKLVKFFVKRNKLKNVLGLYEDKEVTKVDVKKR